MTVEEIVIAAAVLRIAPPTETLRHIDTLIHNGVLALDWNHDMDKYKTRIVTHPRVEAEINHFLLTHQ